MDYRKLILSVLAFAAGSGWAGYAQVARPAGLSNTASGGFQYKAAANDSFMAKNTVLTNSALNVAGTMVTVPVALRYASNASAIASTFSFGNPWLFGALALGSVALDYYASNKVSVESGVWVQKTTGEFCLSDCYEYAGFNYATQANQWYVSEAIARASQVASYNATYSTSRLTFFPNGDRLDTFSKENYTQGYYGASWRFDTYVIINPEKRSIPPYNQTTTTPLSAEQYHRIFDPLPIPEGLPQIMPIALPVDDPWLNPVGVPTPTRSPQPGKDSPPLPDAVPASRPLFVPVGDPVLVPQSNPQVWDQPYVKVVPSPTPDDKFRVDIQPKTVEKTDSSPMSDPQIDPTAPKVPDPANPTDPTQSPKDKERTPGLCDLYPDILACQKLDTPDASNIDNRDVNVSINPDAGWGPANGSCPAPRVLALHGLTTEFSWQPMCDFASGIRGVILAVAWLIAAGSVIGMARRD